MTKTDTKRLLLVQALSMEGPGIEYVYPLGLVTVGTYLEASRDYDLTLLDLNLSLDPYQDLQDVIQSVDPDAVLLSFRNLDPLGNRTTSLVVPLKITTGFIKDRIREDVPILIGGTGFSLFPDKLMEEVPELTYGFVGESEADVLAFVTACLSGDRKALDTIPGSIYRDTDSNGKPTVIQNGRGRAFDMRAYKSVNRDLLSPVPYLERNSYVESIGIESKRGCPFSCAYCSYPLLQGNCSRLRDPEDVVDEILMLEEKYKMERFHFTDPIVNAPPEHFDTICRLLIDRGVKAKWSGFFREETITKERAELYKQAGCSCFSLSPDGLTQEALDQLGKHLKVSDILRCAEILADTGVVTVYHFLVNTPGMDDAQINEAKNLIKKIYDLHGSSIGTIVLNLIRVLPDTKMAQLCLAEGRIDSIDELLYPYYYNPKEYNALRYELEAYHQRMNIENWQKRWSKKEGDVE